MSRLRRPWRTRSTSSRSRRSQRGRVGGAIFRVAGCARQSRGRPSARLLEPLHAVDQQPGIGGLEHHAFSLKFGCGKQLRIVHPRGQHDTVGGRRLSRELLQEVQARAVGHVNVEEQQVGLELRTCAMRFQACGRGQSIHSRFRAEACAARRRSSDGHRQAKLGSRGSSEQWKGDQDIGAAGLRNRAESEPFARSTRSFNDQGIALLCGRKPVPLSLTSAATGSSSTRGRYRSAWPPVTDGVGDRFAHSCSTSSCRRIGIDGLSSCRRPAIDRPLIAEPRGERAEFRDGFGELEAAVATKRQTKLRISPCSSTSRRLSSAAPFDRRPACEPRMIASIRKAAPARNCTTLSWTSRASDRRVRAAAPSSIAARRHAGRAPRRPTGPISGRSRENRSTDRECPKASASPVECRFEHRRSVPRSRRCGATPQHRSSPKQERSGMARRRAGSANDRAGCRTGATEHKADQRDRHARR